MSKRMTPTDRNAAILESAIVAAQAHGFSNVRLIHIAEQAKCSTALVISHYSTMPQMRRAIMRAAIKRGLLGIIANGLATKDPTALKAPEELRKKAAKSLAN